MSFLPNNFQLAACVIVMVLGTAYMMFSKKKSATDTALAKRSSPNAPAFSSDAQEILRDLLGDNKFAIVHFLRGDW